MAECLPTYAQLLRLLGRGPGRTTVTVWIVALVLVGGVLPAAYGYGLPHEHIYLGASTAVSSKDHHHDNPLAVVLGSLAPVDDDVPVAMPSTPTPPLKDGSHVLSVYSGGSNLVLSAIGVAVVPPVLAILCRRDTASRVAEVEAELVCSGTAVLPTPPPPRTLWSPQSSFLAMVVVRHP